MTTFHDLVEAKSSGTTADLEAVRYDLNWFVERFLEHEFTGYSDLLASLKRAGWNTEAGELRRLGDKIYKEMVVAKKFTDTLYRKLERAGG